MNLKKFAVRGIVILAICVALCMFFSGTVRTITTPKVKLTAAKRGKLEERIELTCKPAFPDAEEIDFELPEDMSLTIVKVNTREGYTVNEGDVVVEAKVANFDQLRKQYQEAYDAAVEQLMTLENKNRDVRVNKRDQAYADAWFALRDARHRAVSLSLELDSLLAREGLEQTQTGYPDGASDELKTLMDDWREAENDREKAQEAMDAASRYTVDETVWSYITDQREQQGKRDEAEANLKQLVTLNDQAAAIKAPRDGYIAALGVKEGDAYDGAHALYSLTPEDKLPVLRADISQVERTITEGTAATYNPDSYDPVETEVVTVGTDADGKNYADIELTKQLIKARGSVYSMMQEDTPMTLVFRAREATSLLPTSAVRGSGDDRYIYVAEQNNAAFGGSTLKLHKLEVKVLGEYGGTTSVQDDVTYYSVAYGEDRAVDDGDAVMEYLN
ncbi:MAG: hypothetical protein IJH09_08775 [Clostridia bacterium]|nr:hypothetical protein [Clostridia bacterium]